MVNKNWILSIATPFGIEEYSMIFSQIIPFVSGKVFSNKGEMHFKNGTIIDNEILIESSMEYPISCNIKIQGKINDDSIFGYVYIDDYLKVPFKGSV
jgi:hypothetical protein